MSQVDGSGSRRLDDVSPELARLLKLNAIVTPSKHAVSEIRCETVMVPMRDGVRLATDLYFPPKLPAPAIAMRTPYDRGVDAFAGTFLAFARRGYVVVSQDCRGTGGSEPDSWDYLVHESEDGYDLVDWVVQQEWFDGFLGSCGGSYTGVTQWPMATHHQMSTIIPGVSGLGVIPDTASRYMFLNVYPCVVGKSENRIPVHITEMEQLFEAETLAGGYFNEPLHRELPSALLDRFPRLRDLSPSEAKRWLWDQYCTMTSAQRAELIKEALGVKNVTTAVAEVSLSTVFGHQISHGRHILPRPRVDEVAASIQAPILLRTSWYDWSVYDTLATWQLLMRSAPEPVRSRSRLFISPSAHNMPGYHEGISTHPELLHPYGADTAFDMQLHWYETVRAGEVESWPTVTYYLMGANEWRVAEAWPVPEARTMPFYLGAQGALSQQQPDHSAAPDSYTYDPDDPTPTVGGSIVSYRYPPGSVDVSEVQRRPDVLTYTSEVLEGDVDVVGPLRLVLYASSTAVDTDFVARLSDVFPDGRALQLQSGLLRARYRDLEGEPALLEPGRVYRFEIDMWATANRFAAGHRIRLDISSADFPKFDRNANRGGEPGPPVPATQSVYHDPDHPSHVVLPVVAPPSDAGL